MPLVSLLLCSNRPENLASYFDRLEAVTSNPANVEAVVKIDEGDGESLALVELEKAARPFAIKYLVSARPRGFHELWRSYDQLHALSDPGSYFLAIHNDEVFFRTPGWDEVLARYVGYFDDDIFRLRVSQFRWRNYRDHWECGYAPDSYAFATRQWIDLQDNWAPVEGPDTFQQLVAYYLSRLSWPRQMQTQRDIAIPGIELGGEVALVGLSDTQRIDRVRAGIPGWIRLMSRKTQRAALRRAGLLEAHIRARETDVPAQVVEDPAKRRFLVRRPGEPDVEVAYRKLRRSIAATNFHRMQHYFYYGGGGPEIRTAWWEYQRDFYFLRYLNFRDHVKGFLTSRGLIRR